MLCTLTRHRIVFTSTRCFWSHNDSSKKPLVPVKGNERRDKNNDQDQEYRPQKASNKSHDLDPQTAVSKILGDSKKFINMPRSSSLNISYKNKFHKDDEETAMEVGEMLQEGPRIWSKESRKFQEEWKRRKLESLYNRKCFDDTPKKNEVHVELDFKDEDAVSQWRIGADSFVNQGYSKCELFRTDRGTAIFRGYLTNETFKDGKVPRAGWASMKSNVTKSFNRDKVFKNWEKYSHLLIKCRGDGRSYKVMLYCPWWLDVSWGNTWSFPLHTHGGPYWQYTKIPFSKFFFTIGGRIQDKQEPVDMEHLKAISIGIMDRIEGEFQLEIDYIGVYHDPAHTENFAYENYVIPLFNSMSF